MYSWATIGGAQVTPVGLANTSANVNFATSTGSSVTVRVGANNACVQSSPGSRVVTVNTSCRTLAEEAVPNSYLAYPNPTTGRMTISFTSEEKSKFTLRVTDLLGNVLISDVVNAEAGNNMKEVNLSNAAKGLYLVNLTSDNGSIKRLRLVVE